ncbi:hypothetical protein HC744_16910 [Arthrobacter sp. S1_S22]|nr:hypothetical protein [Arthrobacter sp. S1_S22]
MNLIVCGDALWISCGTWIAIWNGAIGAFVAAVIGGLVALGVVRLTNAQQREQANEGRVIAAIADFVAEAHGLRSVYDAGDDGAVEERYLRMKAAVVRLRMASRSVWHLSQILEEWTYQLRKATLLYERAEVHESTSTSAVGRLLEDTMDILDVLPEWAFADSLRRDSHYVALGRRLDALVKSITELDDAVEKELAARPNFFLLNKKYPS